MYRLIYAIISMLSGGWFLQQGAHHVANHSGPQELEQGIFYLGLAYTALRIYSGLTIAVIEANNARDRKRPETP